MNITLIGMPGVGKSLIGRALAKILGYTFIDIDRIIEKKTKLKLQGIIDKFGEEEFSNIEERATLELNLDDRCIVSPGGSVVYSRKAMKFLKKHSIIVFLNASSKSIDSWISNKSKRGIIRLKNKGLNKLFAERVPLYEKYADLTVRLSENYFLQRVVENIIKKALRICS